MNLKSFLFIMFSRYYNLEALSQMLNASFKNILFFLIFLKKFYLLESTGAGCEGLREKHTPC